MRAIWKLFSESDSKQRLDNILNESDSSFPEQNEIPDSAKLTYKNGYYVNCSAIFVDIRGSKSLTDKYKRPTLAKIYRCFISEIVAVSVDSTKCREVNIQGDCVWSVYNTPYKADINDVFSTAAKMNSIIKLINKRMAKKGIDPIHVGIGMGYGRALMVKAGFNGSGLNDVVYMGDVVNKASDMCSQADTGSWQNKAQVCTEVFYNNLNDHNKSLMRSVRHSVNRFETIYQGSFVNTYLEKWVKDNG